MCILFLTTQGASITKESHRLIVEKGRDKLLEIQTRKTSSVITFGNIQISSQALALLGSEGIPVTFLYENGKVKGQFLGESDKNLELRYKQYKLLEDPSSHMSVTRLILLSKLNRVEQFYRNSRAKNEIISQYDIHNELEAIRRKISEASEYDELLGYEGTAAKLHFGYYSQLFRKEIRFSHRSKHPPQDEANALLSLGYTLMFNLVNGICRGSGLDTYAGFLHKPDYGRHSVSLDMLEMYRVYVERFVLNMCNLEVIKKNDFIGNLPGQFLLNEAGMKKYLLQWSNFVLSNGQAVVRDLEGSINKFVTYLKNYHIKASAA